MRQWDAYIDRGDSTVHYCTVCRYKMHVISNRTLCILFYTVTVVQLDFMTLQQTNRDQGQTYRIQHIRP